MVEVATLSGLTDDICCVRLGWVGFFVIRYFYVFLKFLKASHIMIYYDRYIILQCCTKNQWEAALPTDSLEPPRESRELGAKMKHRESRAFFRKCFKRRT